LQEKIKKIDSAKIFVLPSKSEAMPQSLIEAMSRGKIVISSNNQGSKELIENNKNGFLFKIGDEKELAEEINLALSKPHEEIKKSAIKSVERFKWDLLIKKLEKIIVPIPY
jgi:glycosyltransferase involved in cell wall biosynthesis